MFGGKKKTVATTTVTAEAGAENVDRKGRVLLKDVSISVGPKSTTTIPNPSDHTVTETTFEPSETEADDDDVDLPVQVGNTFTTTTTTTTTVTTNDGPAAACYLLYEPDSSGRLVEHYSMTPVEGAIGKWIPGVDKKIAPFKLKRNAGRNVLIGSCSAGVQGRRNYCNGWCQFVKSAYVQNGHVQLWDPTGKGMMVDVYLYLDSDGKGGDSKGQTVKIEQGGPPVSTDKLLAVACLPKTTTFFEHMTVPLNKWLQDARDHGYSTKI